MKDNDPKFPTILDIARSAVVGGGAQRCLNRDQQVEQETLRRSFGDFGPPGTGVILPYYEERAAMSATGTTTTSLDQGGQTIVTSRVPQLGAALRAAIVLEEMGAQVFGGCTANLALPTMPATIAAAWKSENAAAGDITDLFATLGLAPLRVTGYLTVSRQLLMQTPDIEAFLRRELMGAIGVEIQRAAIAGAGTGGAPLGILNTVGIASVAGGANGLAPTNANLTDLEYAVNGTGKTDRGTCGWITSPWVRRKLRQTPMFGTVSESIWARDSAYNLFGHPAAVTTSSPDNLTKGTSNGVCSAIVYGELSELIMAYWGAGIAIEVLTSVALATQGLVTIHGTAYFNCGVRSPKAFAAMLDALAA